MICQPELVLTNLHAGVSLEKVHYIRRFYGVEPCECSIGLVYCRGKKKVKYQMEFSRGITTENHESPEIVIQLVLKYLYA